jgi:hypothetical protein
MLGDKMSEGSDLLERVNELRGKGFDTSQAFAKGVFEQKIKAWPSGWGDDLYILIYGDFQPPNKDISLPALGITINHESKEKKKTIVGSAMCVLGASVKIKDKSMSSIIDAIRRINLLLGAWTLVEHGNGALGWWSYITHDSGGAVLIKLGDTDVNPVIGRILSLAPPVRQKIYAALYWIREPQNLFLNSFQSDTMRNYSAYWNAFECLTDAVNKIKPRSKLSQSEKQTQIDEFIKARKGKLTSADIMECYSKIVNPGFRAEASHALTVCFPNDAERYINECFGISGEHNRLYKIRNSINHGDIDAENPEELNRVNSRLYVLHEIVWGMFAQLIRFSSSVQEVQKDSNPK